MEATLKRARWPARPRQGDLAVRPSGGLSAAGLETCWTRLSRSVGQRRKGCAINTNAAQQIAVRQNPSLWLRVYEPFAVELPKPTFVVAGQDACDEFMLIAALWRYVDCYGFAGHPTTPLLLPLGE